MLLGLPLACVQLLLPSLLLTSAEVVPGHSSDWLEAQRWLPSAQPLLAVRQGKPLGSGAARTR